MVNVLPVSCETRRVETIKYLQIRLKTDFFIKI